MITYNLLHMLRKFHVGGEGGEAIDRVADSKADQGGRYRFLSREAMACTRIIGVSPGSPFPAGIRYGMIRFWSTKTHDESTGLSESAESVKMVLMWRDTQCFPSAFTVGGENMSRFPSIPALLNAQ